ncbi:MAG: hypothetical protein QME62_14515, partial [Armatimonadota bacterium]|nr:hypothetical protein [Armatimonadota bacterium]
SQGKFSAKVVLFQSKAGKITARGTVNLKNSSITSLYLNAPIRPFTANIEFAGTNLTLIGHGQLNHSPLKIQGKIHGFTPSQLSLHITSNRLNLNTIEKTVRSLPKIPRTQWQSPAKLSATITGTSEQPFVKAVVMVPHAVILNKKVAFLLAQGFYREGVISINRLTARTEIGNVRLNSQVFVRSKRITASGEVSSINLAKLQPQFAIQISGFANAKFSVDYLRKLRTAKILANVRDGKIGNLFVSQSQANIVFAGPQLAKAEITIGRSVAPGILIEKGVGNIAWQNRKIIINHAIIDTLKGSVTANGSMTADGILSLDVSANNINMQTLLHPLGYEEFAGTANFKGTLSGMISNPKLSG